MNYHAHMSMNGEPAPQVELKTSFVEPIGPVTIGKIDPRILTREQFQASPHLLHHGSEQQFTFNRSLDYTSFSAPNSETLGNGLYLTDKFEEAALVSVNRGNSADNAVVYSLLPYQARMLDLRSRIDPRNNAHVPPELVTEWYTYVKQLKEQFLKQNRMESLIKRTVESLRAEVTDEVLKERKELARLRTYQTAIFSRVTHLNEVILKSQPISVRDMIGIEAGGSGGQSALPRDFTKFMIGGGFDGLIYLEKGDHVSQGTIPSFVFYKLDHIGTYDMWHEKPATVEAE